MLYQGRELVPMHAWRPNDRYSPGHFFESARLRCVLAGVSRLDITLCCYRVGHCISVSGTLQPRAAKF